jgi:hypothetical protein
MIRSKSCRIIIAILTVTLVNACTFKGQNLTPSEFPSSANTDPYPHKENLYFGQRTLDQVVLFEENPAHRLFLEIEVTNMSDITSYVTVNGVEHQMSNADLVHPSSSGEGLWFYIPRDTDKCTSSYDYFFRTRATRLLGGWKDYLTGSSSEPFTVAVPHCGTP